MIRFICAGCRQPLEVPDSQAGQIEICPGCQMPNEVPTPHQKAAPAAHVARGGNRVAGAGRHTPPPPFGLERVLEFVGVLTASLGMAAVLGGLAFLLMMRLEDESISRLPQIAAIAGGISSFVAGLALAALGTMVVELKRIRGLLERGRENER